MEQKSDSEDAQSFDDLIKTLELTDTNILDDVDDDQLGDFGASDVIPTLDMGDDFDDFDSLFPSFEIQKDLSKDDKISKDITMTFNELERKVREMEKDPNDSILEISKNYDKLIKEHSSKINLDHILKILSSQLSNSIDVCVTKYNKILNDKKKEEERKIYSERWMHGRSNNAFSMGNGFPPEFQMLFGPQFNFNQSPNNNNRSHNGSQRANRYSNDFYQEYGSDDEDTDFFDGFRHGYGH